jgi:hypothetical protein
MLNWNAAHWREGAAWLLDLGVPIPLGTRIAAHVLTSRGKGERMEDERVEWAERREVGLGDKELFFVIGDKIAGNWEFWEKSTWETQWYKMASTPALIAKAEALLSVPPLSEALAA